MNSRDDTLCTSAKFERHTKETISTPGKVSDVRSELPPHSVYSGGVG